MTGQMTRRTVLLSVPMLGAASRLLAQAGRSALAVRALNHIAIAVSDKKRSMEFYQGLFGWPIQHTQGSTTGMRIGAGPQYITMSQGKPGFGHLCVTVEGFDVDRITQVLARHGVSRTDNSDVGPMKAWVRMRTEANGGAKEGTPEFYVNDPDGYPEAMSPAHLARWCRGYGCAAKTWEERKEGHRSFSSPTPTVSQFSLRIRATVEERAGVSFPFSVQPSVLI